MGGELTLRNTFFLLFAYAYKRSYTVYLHAHTYAYNFQYLAVKSANPRNVDDVDYNSVRDYERKINCNIRKVDIIKKDEEKKNIIIYIDQSASDYVFVINSGLIECNIIT